MRPGGGSTPLDHFCPNHPLHNLLLLARPLLEKMEDEKVARKAGILRTISV